MAEERKKHWSSSEINLLIEQVTKRADTLRGKFSLSFIEVFMAINRNNFPGWQLCNQVTLEYTVTVVQIHQHLVKVRVM